MYKVKYFILETQQYFSVRYICLEPYFAKSIKNHYSKFNISYVTIFLMTKDTDKSYFNSNIYILS